MARDFRELKITPVKSATASFSRISPGRTPVNPTAKRRRAPRRSSHAVARRAWVASPASPRATGSHEWRQPESSLRSSLWARGRADGSEERMAATRARRLAAAECAAGYEPEGKP
jgi:hypothetical protein